MVIIQDITETLQVLAEKSKLRMKNIVRFGTVDKFFLGVTLVPKVCRHLLRSNDKLVL